MVWDPLTANAYQRSLQCPLCQVSSTLDVTIHWTDGRSARLQPRKLYASSCSVLLLSRVYKCSKCNQQYLSHDPRILEEVQRFYPIPFVLMHRCGFTRELVNLIFGLVNQGMPFYSIETLLPQLHWLNSPADIDSDSVQGIPTTGFMDRPSNDIVAKCFLSRFLEVEYKYAECMQSITADHWTAFDHTFKIAANIGYQRESSWITQYNSAFIVLNEKGQVLSWQLTTSTSLDEVEQLLCST